MKQLLEDLVWFPPGPNRLFTTNISSTFLQVICLIYVLSIDKVIDYVVKFGGRYVFKACVGPAIREG